jgi:hypothetical protein
MERNEDRGRRIRARSVTTYDSFLSDVPTEAGSYRTPEPRHKCETKVWSEIARQMPLLNSRAEHPDLRRRQYRSLLKKSRPQAWLWAPKVTIKRFVSLHPPHVTQKPRSRDLPRIFVFIVMSYKAPTFAVFYVSTKQGHSSSQVPHKCRHYAGCLCAVTMQPS